MPRRAFQWQSRRSGTTLVSRDFRLKFNPRPDNLTHEQFRDLKQAIIQAAVAHDLGLLSYLILHNICSSMDEARRNGINTVCFHFDCCLARMKSQGLVLLDRFNDRNSVIDGHLTEKFSVGLKDVPYSKEYRLKHILGLHYIAVWQLHFTSLVAIVIKSARYRDTYQGLKDFLAEAGIAVEDLDLVIPDLLTRTYYDSTSPTGLLEDHVRFTAFRAYASSHSGGGVRSSRRRCWARRGSTRQSTSLRPRVRRELLSPDGAGIFKGLPEADRLADKMRAALEFGADNTRVMDLFEIEAAVHAGRSDAEPVGRARTATCAARGVEIAETPNCFTDSYTVRHQATWETWAAKSELKENRTRAEVAAAIRQPVEQA
jgi:hypothetical protein